jgi:hypothetical protein
VEAGRAHRCIRNIRMADFDDDFNKTRQSASDVILQEGGRFYRYSDASQKKSRLSLLR